MDRLGATPAGGLGGGVLDDVTSREVLAAPLGSRSRAVRTERRRSTARTLMLSDLG